MIDINEGRPTFKTFKRYHDLQTSNSPRGTSDDEARFIVQKHSVAIQQSAQRIVYFRSLLFIFKRSSDLYTKLSVFNSL